MHDRQASPAKACAGLLLPFVGRRRHRARGGRSPARRWADRLCRRRAKTWEVSKPYMLAPFEKRGELDQGILRFTWYSLVRVAQGLLAGAS